jgi:UDP:flavonoid glycosyltransferase YjiC (YdhE family)
VFDVLEKKIKEESFRVHENTLLLPFAPQVDILKRASLFITHAGMNSVSESIQYGVPLICVPQYGDQPLVAYRVSLFLFFYSFFC